MESNKDKIKRIIDNKIEIIGYKDLLKKDSYQLKYRKLTGLLVDNDIFNNDISNYLFNWLIFHIPGGMKLSDSLNIESKSLRASIIKTSNKNPLYTDDKKFDKFDIIKAKEFIGITLNEDNSYLDIDNDGTISKNDIQLLRNALWTDTKYNNILFRDGLSKKSNIEDLVLLEIKPTSTVFESKLNNMTGNKIMCKVGDTIKYEVKSGKYVESGNIEIENIDDIIKVIVIDQDIDSKTSSNVFINNGNKILQEDISISRVAGGIVASNNTSIDLNNFNITTNSGNYASFLVRGTQEYTFNGDGIIEDNSKTSGGVVWSSSEKCKVTINSGTFISHTTSSQCIYCEQGTIEINGGTFKSDTYSATNDRRYMLNCKDANYKSGKAKIIVSGGTFYGFDPGNNLAEGQNTSFLKEGYVSNEIGEEDGIKIYQVTKK